MGMMNYANAKPLMVGGQSSHTSAGGPAALMFQESEV